MAEAALAEVVDGEVAAFRRNARCADSISASTGTIAGSLLPPVKLYRGSGPGRPEAAGRPAANSPSKSILISASRAAPAAAGGLGAS